VMLGFIIGYRVLCFVILWFRCYRRRWNCSSAFCSCFYCFYSIFFEDQASLHNLSTLLVYLHVIISKR
jgi:hypothetical protein